MGDQGGRLSFEGFVVRPPVDPLPCRNRHKQEVLTRHCHANNGILRLPSFRKHLVTHRSRSIGLSDTEKCSADKGEILALGFRCLAVRVSSDFQEQPENLRNVRHAKRNAIEVKSDTPTT
ncbi:hypothetical protein T265_01133 [Opisthorchis viverrini]|uniref:Uncharacterized protein n=1 Tax=Opisthorchis viverrini TaxID=6198 RepID=A0A075AJ65_OPIVI|nr:hypothetical protein T265_01133 [Opisthorchis viverrini]KER32844.1 hypothetical protein T265_01133 [Opisthorchis viverrini]